MSYNSLHSYWSSRHRNDMAENSICWKREREQRRHQSLEENNNYHRQCEMLANRYSVFEDGRPLSSNNRRNCESLVEERIREQKEKTINKRRERLAKFLFTEQEKFEREIKEKRDLERQADPLHMKAMRERLELLRDEQEAEQLQEAERKLYQRRQMNSFSAERVNAERIKKDTLDYWDTQVQNKQKELIAERAKSARFEEEQRKEYERQVQQMEQERKIKRAENEVWVDGLQLQMHELKDKERKEKELRDEESRLVQFEQELRKIKEEQKEIQKARKKRELSEILDRQHKAKLRERALEVQHQLEQDKKFLESTFGRESEHLTLVSAKREKLKSDIEWMKSIITEQLKLEKERQTEIQLLYQEEAEKMWQKREAEWKREREARHKLMTEVLDGLKGQVQEKISRNHQEQEEAARERDALQDDVHRLEKQLSEERHETAENRERYKKELLGQIKEKELREKKEKDKGQQLVTSDSDLKPLPGLM